MSNAPRIPPPPRTKVDLFHLFSAPVNKGAILFATLSATNEKNKLGLCAPSLSCRESNIIIQQQWVTLYRRAQKQQAERDAYSSIPSCALILFYFGVVKHNSSSFHLAQSHIFPGGVIVGASLRQDLSGTTIYGWVCVVSTYFQCERGVGGSKRNSHH